MSETRRERRREDGWAGRRADVRTWRLDEAPGIDLAALSSRLVRSATRSEARSMFKRLLGRLPRLPVGTVLVRLERGK